MSREMRPNSETKSNLPDDKTAWFEPPEETFDDGDQLAPQAEKPETHHGEMLRGLAHTPKQPAAESDVVVDELKRQLAATQEELKVYLDALQRLKAEFDNYRKRVTRERSQLEQAHKELFILKMLPIKDNLERALDNAKNESSFEGLLSGMEITRQLFESILSELNIRKIPTVNQIFDPNLHDAIGAAPRDDLEPGTIIQEVLPGYTMDDRVIRAAGVVVSG